jgi:hypothetical protein
MKKWTSEVRILFFWKIPVQRYTFRDLAEAKKYENVILWAVKPIWRPLCSVKWIEEAI